jgi:hypothetical protein
MEEVTKSNVADKPKPKWKSKFKKRNEVKEAKEAKVLKFAKMWKEMTKESHQGKEKRLSAQREESLSNLMEERQRETCDRTRK